MTNYHNSPRVFNNYFLTVSENIIKISGSTNKNMIPTIALITIYRINQWRTEGGFGVFNTPPEIPKF